MDLSTTYLGLPLKNPIVASASPMSRTVGSIRLMEDYGASAVVLYSIFEEQIRHESKEIFHHLTAPAESYAEATSYFPEPHEYHAGPDEYLEHIRRVKESVGIPVIGSINGVTDGGWIEYAKLIEQAGVDALELNIYYIPTDSSVPSDSIEKTYYDIVNDVRSQVKIPIAVKMSPFFTSVANVARNLDAMGVNGLVLFNRFYQPDINLDTLNVEPGVVLSSSNSIRLPLRWIAILNGKIKASLAATTGVHTAEDVIKLTMAGADVTMMCSALLRHGPRKIREVLDDMQRWMIDREYESLNMMRGSMSHKNVADPSAFERANYMKALQSYM
ncbi:MAG: dihydroorotate dehydrogenase-like protein [Bacteroidetes bacterium]|nr:dihydroorotate dehydrogenase-like protein [Bacteroidota bacterium]